MPDFTKVPNGKNYTIVKITGGRKASANLEALGIIPGAVITKVSSNFGGGPIVLKIGKTQFAIGRGIASKVIVEEK